MKTFKNINWTNALFLSLSPIVAALGLWFYFYLETFSWSMITLFFVFYFVSGLSITAGYHRLFAHRAYKANPLVKIFYLIFGAGAFENSAKEWCQDHRVHHKKVDSEEDPYCAKKGFFFSHIGWILLKAKKKKYDKDLANDPLIQWQHKHYLMLAIFSGIVLPTLIGALLGSALGGFVFGAALRIVFTHHCTFFINSLAHMWGAQPYSTKNTAKDNPILAFFTYGEGYHNFHHKFEGDFRNGIHWYHFDPTKWTIQILARFGLARRLVRIPEEEILKAKLRASQDKIHIKYSDIIKAEYLEKLEALGKTVEEKQRAFRKLHRDYKLMAKQVSDSGRDKVQEMKFKMKLAKMEFRNSYREWKGYRSNLRIYC